MAASLTVPSSARLLNLARLTGATLVSAKLDRLSLNAAFLLTLQGSGVRFLAVDMREANDLTVGIIALDAQQEREDIYLRTARREARQPERCCSIICCPHLVPYLSKQLRVEPSWQNKSCGVERI